MRLLLEETRIFKAHDELEFFLLHACNLLLVELLFVRFALKLAFDLGARAILSLDKVHLTLGGRLLLLVLYHHFDILRLLLF